MIDGINNIKNNIRQSDNIISSKIDITNTKFKRIGNNFINIS